MKAVARTSAISSPAFNPGAWNFGDDSAMRAEQIATLRLGLGLGTLDHVLTVANLAELDRLFPPRDGVGPLEMHVDLVTPFSASVNQRYAGSKSKGSVVKCDEQVDTKSRALQLGAACVVQLLRRH
jgi:hypothetical protein